MVIGTGDDAGDAAAVDLVLGVLAGYFRGWVDDLIQYLYTTLSPRFPGVLLIAAAVLMMQVYDRHTIRRMVSRPPPKSVPTCACWRCACILGVTSWTGSVSLVARRDAEAA
jgi:peptide/nickel transport system permease protein